MQSGPGSGGVRAFRPEDAGALACQASDPAVAAFMADAQPRRYTEAEAAAWIEFVRRETPPCHFAIEAADALVGGIGLDRQGEAYAHSAEIHYWLAHSHWGRGLATAAVAAVTDYAFGTLALVRVYARVLEGNTASQRVLAKCGYTLEGRLRHGAAKDGRLFDVFLYAKLCP